MLAELLELAPAGVEERDVGDDVVEYAVYGAPGELPALPRPAGRGGRRARRGRHDEVADDWARALARVPRARSTVARARCACAPPWHEPAPRRDRRARDRPRPGVRHRRARDDAAVPRAAARRSSRPGRSSTSAAAPACSRSPRRKLGLDAGRSASTTTRVASRRPRENARVNGADVERRAASTCSATARRRPRRRCSPTCCARCCCAWRATGSPARRRARSIASGLLAHEADEIAAAFAAHGPARAPGGAPRAQQAQRSDALAVARLHGGGDVLPARGARPTAPSR